MINEIFFDFEDNIEYKKAKMESAIDSVISSLNNQCTELNLQIKKLNITIRDLQHTVGEQELLLSKCLTYISLPWYKRLFTKFKQ